VWVAVLIGVSSGLLTYGSNWLTLRGAALAAAAVAVFGFAVDGLLDDRSRPVMVTVVLVTVCVAGYCVLFERVRDDQQAGPPPGKATGRATGTPSRLPTARATPSRRPSATPTSKPRTSSTPAPRPPSTRADRSVPVSAGTISWIPEAKRTSHSAPTIDVFDQGGADGGRKVQFALDHLSMGAVEFDVTDPRGGTLFGMSFGNPESRKTMTYVLRPTEAGSYKAAIRPSSPCSRTGGPVTPTARTWW
jgi:hypothetical protein